VCREAFEKASGTADGRNGCWRRRNKTQGGAKGVVTLNEENDDSRHETSRMQHTKASPHGEFVLLVETQRAEWGEQQQTRYQSPAGRLIDLFRREGECLGA
jgi:hypothetical protein